MTKSIHEFRVGEKATVTKTISISDIEKFALVTGDSNPVHLDDSAAAKSIFGKRVAHGMLSAGLISAVLGTKLPGEGTVYLSQTLRFAKPVFPEDSITAEVEILEIFPPKNRMKLSTICRNQGGETVLDGEALVMITNSKN